jgi:hypothetical protein
LREPSVTRPTEFAFVITVNIAKLPHARAHPTTPMMCERLKKSLYRTPGAAKQMSGI